MSKNVEYVLIGESVIPALDGDNFIYQQHQLFKVAISSEFKKMRSDKNKKATSETIIGCYEIRSMGRYGENIKAMPGTWDQKSVTQSQAIKFCEQSKNLLATAHDAPTIFLCKLDEYKPVSEIRPYDNLIVLTVYYWDGDLQAVWTPLHFGDTIGENYFYRIAMPKI